VGTRFRCLVAAPLGALLVLALLPATPAQATPFNDFVGLVNSTLDDRASTHETNAGFRAARQLFETPKYTKAAWDDAGRLCMAIELQPSAKGAANAADLAWILERGLLEAVRSAGATVADFDDFMLVRFTILSAGANYRCPQYNTLVMEPFSDALYALFTSYKESAANGASSGAQATPGPVVTTQPAETLGAGFPAGAVVTGEGRSKYLQYATNRQPDTCFTNPMGAGAGGFVHNIRPNSSVTVSRGEALSWVELSNLGGVDYCTDGEYFNFHPSVSKRNQACRMQGQSPTFNISSKNSALAPVTTSGGLLAVKKGTCVVSLWAQRAGLSVDRGRLVITVV
jgi:hypothetical protein